MTTFLCEPCAFKTALKNNYERHMVSKRHLAKCACAAAPVVQVAAVNTIDNYFKRITADAEAVSARLETVAAHVADVVVIIDEVKQEIRTKFDAFELVLAEVKVSIEVNKTNSILLSENESLKHVNASLRVELEHVREMAELRIENAILKAQSEQPRYKQEKEPKQKEEKQEQKQKEDPKVVEERKRIHAMLETEAEKLNDVKGEALIQYWIKTKKHIADDNEHMTEEHRALRDTMLQAAINEMAKVEIADAQGLFKCSDRMEKMAIFNYNCGRTWNICANIPSLKKFRSQEHFLKMNQMSIDACENYSGIVQGATYDIQSTNYQSLPTHGAKKEKEAKPSKQVSAEEYERTRVKQKTDKPIEKNPEKNSLKESKRQCAEDLAEFNAAIETDAQDECEINCAISGACHLTAEEIREVEAKWDADHKFNGDESDDEPVKMVRKPKAAAAIESEESDDEPCLSNFTYKKKKYLRDKENNKIYDVETKEYLGRYMQSYDTIDFLKKPESESESDEN